MTPHRCTRALPPAPNLRMSERVYLWETKVSLWSTVSPTEQETPALSQPLWMVLPWGRVPVKTVFLIPSKGERYELALGPETLPALMTRTTQVMGIWFQRWLAAYGLVLSALAPTEA